MQLNLGNLDYAERGFVTRSGLTRWKAFGLKYCALKHSGMLRLTEPRSNQLALTAATSALSEALASPKSIRVLSL